MRGLSNDVISGRGSIFFEKQPLRSQLPFDQFSIFFNFLNWILKLIYWTMFCMYRFLIQTGSTELKPSKVRGFFWYFLRFQASLFSTYFTLFYKTLIKYMYSYQVYLKNKKIILYQYVFNFGHPEKRSKSPKLPEISKWTLLTWMYMLFDIIIYLNNFMLQNNEMSKGRIFFSI